MKKFALLATAVAAFAVPQLASAATFDSGMANFQYYAYGGAYLLGGSPATFSAPGSTSFFTNFDVSLTGNQIIYTYTEDTLWSPSVVSLNSGGLYVENGSVISSVSGIPAFTSVTLDPSSLLGSSGFTSSNVTWNSGAVAVDWAELSFATGNTVILNVTSSSPGVPEPATWALMLLGFAAVGASMRRKQAARVRFAF